MTKQTRVLILTIVSAVLLNGCGRDQVIYYEEGPNPPAREEQAHYPGTGTPGRYEPAFELPRDRALSDQERRAIAYAGIPATETPSYMGEGFSILDKALESETSAVGWIWQEGCLNNVIVQGDDNEYYLKHGPDGSPSPGGCIFMDCNCPSDFSGLNTIIHGHNMRNGSMFGSLKKYLTRKGYYDAHDTFVIRTPQGTGEYKIISVYHDMYYMGQYQTEFEDLDEFNGWLERTKAKSAYDTGVDITPDLPAITLSSCYSSGDGGDKTIIVLQLQQEYV